MQSKKKPTLIQARAFGKRLGEIESKYRQQSLLEFICQRAGGDDDVLSELTGEPTYVRQLNLVNLDEFAVEDAVIAKLEAKDAVSKWTLEGDIQESSYIKYNDALKRKWYQQKNITFIQNNILSDEDKGRLLYFECLKATEVVELEKKQVDGFFSCGSYQVLANAQDIGWHPTYKIKLKDNSYDS